MAALAPPESRIRDLYAGDIGASFPHLQSRAPQMAPLVPDSWVERPEPVQADFLVMESTYGQPFFRFPPREQVVSALLDHVHTALRSGQLWSAPNCGI